MAPVGKKKRTAKSSTIKNKTEPDIPPAQVPLPAEVTPKPSSTSKDQDESKRTQSDNTGRWYNRTWPRKAAPVTQIARESISSASNAVTEIASSSLSGSSTSLKSSKSPSLQLTRKPSRAAPADATTTRVNATSGASSPPLSSHETPKAYKKSAEETSSTSPNQATAAIDTKAPSENVPDKDTRTSHKKSDKDEADGTETPAGKTVEQSAGSSRWLGWFSKTVEDPSKDDDTKPVAEPTQPAVPSNQDELDTSSKRFEQDHTIDPKTSNEEDKQSNKNVDVSLADTSEQTTLKPPKRTWLQMFSNTSADDVRTEGNTKIPDTPPTVEQLPQTPPASGPDTNAPSIESSPPPNLQGDGKSSGWAFWSRDRTNSSTHTSPECHVGELAISNTPSQKRPKRTSISLEKPAEVQSDIIKTKQKSSKQVAKPSDSRQVSDVSEETLPKGPKKNSSQGLPAKTQDTEVASKALQKAVPNQLLPSFRDTFLLQESPTLMQQLSRLVGYSKSPEPRHLHLVRDPPRIRNALAIGVHGYFPAPLIRTVLGQPTGTSIKFADMATKAIRKWTASRGYDCEVKSAALEGEGRIGERVNLLWKLLLNWIDEIRKSDFILVGCHSQGVPVAVMLVAKLVSFGCINSAKVGICAMAGVNMGPFPDYKSRWISGSAGELFEFSNPTSTVSKDLMASLEACLAFGVRITYVGSIDDQLVSLESSTFSPISHPHIYRAVFIDGRVHAPNFLANLVGFVLKLRNLGVPDHGLVRELSSPLAGSLYSGEGHSRIYEDDEVYDLAVQFALETTSLPSQTVIQRPSTPLATPNPYILPFAMRGLLEEEYVRTDLHNETRELLKQFDDWKPSSKVLKDVKFRLEGIRSKL